MPTIAQLPLAGSTNSTDELVVAQGGVTRGVTLATLLADLQPLIVLNGPAVLGRTSTGSGGVELITAGPGLSLGSGVLSATGSEQAGFAVQPALTPGDDVILNSGGQPRRMSLALLRGLFTAGAHINIDATGLISAAVPAFLAGVGAPPSGLGANGDAYLDSLSGALWAQAGEVWALTGNNILATETNARVAAVAPLVALKASGVATVPVQMTLDGLAQTANRSLALPDARGVMRISGSVTAQNVASGDVIVWDVAAAISRAGPGSMAQLVGTAAVSVFAANTSMTGCSLVLSGGSLGGVLQGVGLSGQVINWSAALLVVIGT